jgi:hypothetical protein
MAREIFALRLLSGALTAVSVYELWARWHAAGPADGRWLPASDAIPLTLAAAFGFAVVASALRRLERERATSR